MTLPPDPRTTYDAQDPAENPPRATKHALVRDVKRLIELTAHLDVNEADLDTVDQIGATVRAASAMHSKRCPACMPRADSARSQAPTAPCSSAAASAAGATRSRHPCSGSDAATDTSRGRRTPRLRGADGSRTRWLRRRRVRRPARHRADRVRPGGLYRHAHGAHAATNTTQRPHRLRSRRRPRRGPQDLRVATASHGDELLAEAEIVFIAPRDGSRPR